MAGEIRPLPCISGNADSILQSGDIGRFGSETGQSQKENIMNTICEKIAEYGVVPDYCIGNEIPVFPGCITPLEIAQAVKREYKIVCCGGS